MVDDLGQGFGLERFPSNANLRQRNGYTATKKDAYATDR